MRATELHSADETKDAMPKFPPKTQCMAASKLPAPHYHILFSCFEFFRSRPQVHLDQVARNGLPNLQHRWPWDAHPPVCCTAFIVQLHHRVANGPIVHPVSCWIQVCCPLRAITSVVTAKPTLEPAKGFMKPASPQ